MDDLADEGSKSSICWENVENLTARLEHVQWIIT